MAITFLTSHFNRDFWEVYIHEVTTRNDDPRKKQQEEKNTLFTQEKMRDMPWIRNEVTRYVKIDQYIKKAKKVNDKQKARHYKISRTSFRVKAEMD